MAIDRVENTASAPAVGVGEGDPGGVEDDGVVVPEEDGMVVPEEDGLVATPAVPARPVQPPDSF